MKITAKKLRYLTVEPGLIKVKAFDEAVTEAKKLKMALADFLVDSELISDEELGHLLADDLRLPYVRLSQEIILRKVLTTIPEAMARKHHVIIFGKENGLIKAAMSNPKDIEAISQIEKKTGAKVRIYYATSQDIEENLTLYKEDIQGEAKHLLKEHLLALQDVGKDEKETQTSIVEMVETIIRYAYQKEASDVHIEPREKDVLVRYRLNGILYDMATLPKEAHTFVVTRLKVMAKLRTDEHRIAQDGHLQQKIDGNKVDIRLSIVPTVDGEKTVMRLLSERNRQFTLTELGMSKEDLKVVTRNIKKPYGMILATGPTGSGKTTTMYAVMKVLNKRSVNIATIEDPVEYDIDDINQIQVNSKTKLTFVNGLRSIVRQDPDIIMVGEIRDKETAKISVDAASTGHLLLSTLHTNSAAGTIPRLLDMDIEPFMLSSTLNAIIAQRLVRKICTGCISSYKVTSEELGQRLPEEVIEAIPNKKIYRFYEGKGCVLCEQNGYMGRIGVFEVLDVTEPIRSLIMKKLDADQIEKKAKEKGMTKMYIDAIFKALDGQISLEEVERVIRD